MRIFSNLVYRRTEISFHLAINPQILDIYGLTTARKACFILIGSHFFEDCIEYIRNFFILLFSSRNCSCNTGLWTVVLLQRYLFKVLYGMPHLSVDFCCFNVSYVKGTDTTSHFRYTTANGPYSNFSICCFKPKF